MTLAPRRPFAPTVPRSRARLLPWMMVLAGSLLTIVPVVADAPILPPFGLLTLLAWRLLAPLSLRRWAPALLGLFDDLVSGQPLGSAMLLWTLAFFLIDLFDQRVMFRSFAQDWMIASVVTILCLAGGRIVAAPIGAHVDYALVLQMLVSILLFPAVSRMVAWIDLRREPE